MTRNGWLIAGMNVSVGVLCAGVGLMAREEYWVASAATALVISTVSFLAGMLVERT